MDKCQVPHVTSFAELTDAEVFHVVRLVVRRGLKNIYQENYE